ncbi:hypothetical protein [Agriterribacter sp.]|uniref:hypothetical protein n=1 Tax=Agriterribacter sp. TaxID=2821509 RepID=UPI002B9A0962|nr:hypothetical protein [Agriterribacter sp.]HRP56165.1 hypothetical protein [Agriterribacter sp.]
MLKPAFISLIVTVLLLFTAQLACAQTGTAAFNRTAFYNAFASNNVSSIQKQLDIVDKSLQDGKEAFEGALMMKKAGLIKGASHKLKVFKDGKEKLETILDQYTNNAEFRFLRLMIQEKAPKILGYDKQLEEDRKYIVEHFKTMPEAARKAVLDYSKSSRVLSAADF